ncbi:lytic transglycosylase domain-containing protein [Xanthobacter sp. V0B-10]|uniref:lytic transglycosylase domain-containing protein n=1 Tax=Xanthobacter albus TaxID=3119929 RepID=UPI0037287C21
MRGTAAEAASPAAGSGGQVAPATGARGTPATVSGSGQEAQTSATTTSEGDADDGRAASAPPIKPAAPAQAQAPPAFGDGARAATQAVQPPPSAQEAGGGRQGESIDAALCRLIDGAARKSGLPAAFLTRLIWRESSFRPHVVSRAGAQGIAQFMPGTARERGLSNPFDPEEAIPASAALLADLERQFGNLGLAAAAYNAGPGRVSGFLAGGGLPQETRTYVRLITGRTAEDWAALKRRGEAPRPETDAPCLTTLATLRLGAPAPEARPNALFAPWGVQVSGNFSKDLALASFRRAADKYQAVFGDAVPVIIATRMAGRGARTFYRVRLPAQTRAEANALCSRLRKAGGPCIVLPN